MIALRFQGDFKEIAGRLRLPRGGSRVGVDPPEQQGEDHTQCACAAATRQEDRDRFVEPRRHGEPRTARMHRQLHSHTQRVVAPDLATEGLRGLGDAPRFVREQQGRHHRQHGRAREPRRERVALARWQIGGDHDKRLHSPPPQLAHLEHVEGAALRIVLVATREQVGVVVEGAARPQQVVLRHLVECARRGASERRRAARRDDLRGGGGRGLCQLAQSACGLLRLHPRERPADHRHENVDNAVVKERLRHAARQAGPHQGAEHRRAVVRDEVVLVVPKPRVICLEPQQGT